MSVPGITLRSRSERDALRRLLVMATAMARRPDLDLDLGGAAARAPVEFLPAAAALHRVSGCVHDALRGLDVVPEPVLDVLAALRREATAFHLGYVRALASVADAWGSEGVEFVAFKGPVLSSAIYGDPGLRTYGDLDLLVGPADLPRAVGVLEELGYEHRIKNWPLAQWFLASEFVMFTGDVEIDLHWHLVYAHYERRSFAIDTAAMLERARDVVVGGRCVRTFDPVDTLLHLCLHATRSGAHRLVWFKDIERSLSVERPDLDQLLARARDFRCGPPVGLALGRAREFLDADVPDDLVDALLGRRFRRVETVACALSPPVRLDERDSLARFVARSARANTRDSLTELATRALRSARRRVPRHPHETADPAERDAFLDTVARGGRSCE